MSHSECQSHPLSETLLGPGLLVLLVADTMRRTGLRGGGQGKKRDPFAGDLGLYFGLERRPVLSPVIGVFRAVLWECSLLTWRKKYSWTQANVLFHLPLWLSLFWEAGSSLIRKK